MGQMVVLVDISPSLCRFHVVPDFSVLGTTRDILPEINLLLVVLNVVEVKAFDLIRAHELSSLRIRRHIMGLVRNQFLGLGLTAAKVSHAAQEAAYVAGGSLEAATGPRTPCWSIGGGLAHPEGYADAAGRWEQFGVIPEQAYALLGYGRCLVSLGRQSNAAPVLRQARELFRSLGATPAVSETDELLETATALSS